MRSPLASHVRLLAAAGAFALAATALAGPSVHHVRRGEVAVLCPMTVGGSFEAKTSSVTGQVTLTPGASRLEGSFAVDLATLDTGIELRNRHLRENYLEVQKGDGFAAATLSGIEIAAPDLAVFTGKTTFKGVFSMHGQTREVSGSAEIRKTAEATVVEASFPLLVSDFSIKKPTYLGVGVKNEIKVKVSLDVAPVAATGAEK
jgi:polyisoprenoid-binding protein YceI